MAALKTGYSYATLSANVDSMLRDGYTKEQAAAAAYCLARKSFFATHPQGAIPAFLAYPSGYRLREHYNADGAPKMGTGGRMLTNPRKTQSANATKKERIAAIKLHAGFTGRTPQGGRTIKLKPLPRAGVVMGTLIQVGYKSARDGQLYRHTFRTNRSRPLLIASSDGKQALIVGGQFVITDRGLEDR